MRPVSTYWWNATLEAVHCLEFNSKKEDICCQSYLGYYFNVTTGWPVWSRKRLCWHQIQSSVTGLGCRPNLQLNQLQIWSQHKLFCDHTGHPVPHPCSLKLQWVRVDQEFDMCLLTTWRLLLHIECQMTPDSKRTISCYHIKWTGFSCFSRHFPAICIWYRIIW